MVANFFMSDLEETVSAAGTEAEFATLAIKQSGRLEKTNSVCLPGSQLTAHAWPKFRPLDSV
jgi:hypothetical protein